MRVSPPIETSGQLERYTRLVNILSSDISEKKTSNEDVSQAGASILPSILSPPPPPPPPTHRHFFFFKFLELLSNH